MSDPKLLLMDEPSIGLSPIMVNEVANIVREISNLGVTVVLVEQNARMALRLRNTAYAPEVGRITLAARRRRWPRMIGRGRLSGGLIGARRGALRGV